VFIGIVNVRDVLNSGVDKFISNCKLANLRVNMLSGDERNECLSVGWQSGIIKDSYGYAEWNFETEANGIAQLKKVLQEIDTFDKENSGDNKKNYVKEFCWSLKREEKALWNKGMTIIGKSQIQ
jgi:magnesium-transporting ATPase (P-type)